MICFPAPQLGRDGIDRKPAGWLIIGGTRAGNVPNSRTELVVLSSDNGATFEKRRLRGALPDLAGKGQLFQALAGTHVTTRSGRVVIGLKYFDVSGNDSRAVILTTDNGWDYQERTHPYSAPGNGRGIAAIVQFGADLVAFLETGETLVSDDDGESWEAGAPTGMSLVSAAAANGSAIVVVGGAVLKSSVNPRASFTTRDSKFAGSTISSVAASAAGFVIVGASGKIASGTADGTTFTLRSSGTTGLLTHVFVTGGRWYASGSSDWLTSTNLTSWGVAASDYWASGARSVVRMAVPGSGRTLLFYGADKVAYTTDHQTWQQLLLPDLAGVQATLAAVYRG